MAGFGAQRPFLRALAKVRYLNRGRALSSGSKGYCSCPEDDVSRRLRLSFG
jgi:hypothetical protein